MKIKEKTVTLLKLMKTVGIEAMDDNIFKLSAALAYYTIFSLVPMLVIILWITGIFYDAAHVQGELFIRMQQMLGPEAVKQIQEAIINTKFDQGSVWAKTLSVIALVFTAMGVFTEIQDSINTIWGLKAKPKKGIMKLLLNRLMSFSLLITLGFILIVSLMVNAVISELTLRIQYYFPDIPVLLFYVLNQAVIFVVLAFLFACVFKVLPDAKIKWGDVRGGAIITSLFSMAGKYLIGFYLEQNATISTYGSAGSVIVILLWVYFSAIILFLGAEFTQAYLKLKGKKIQPDQYAVWVNETAIPIASNTEVGKEKIPQ
jgi:membrane protein